MEETYNHSDGKNVPSKISIAMIDEVKSPADVIPLKHRNWSWPSFIFIMVYIIVTVIVGTVAVKGGFQELDAGPRIGWILCMFVGGCGGGAIIYNLGKHIFAEATGYKLAYLCLSGLCWDYSRANPFYCDWSKVLEFHSRFKPKDDDTNRKPVLMSIGGLLIWLMVFAIALVLFIVLISNPTLKTGLITGLVLSGAFPVYEMLPFRTDYPSDMYVIITTAKNEVDRKAYNIYYYNIGNEFADVDYIYPDFDEFDSFWKAKAGMYTLKKQLYEANVDEAVKTMTKLHKAGRYLDEVEKGQLSSERLFFLLLMKDTPGADRFFIGLPKDIKTEILRKNSLAGLRNSLLVNGVLRDKEDASIDNIKSANKVFNIDTTSSKLQHEKKYYILAYNQVKAANSNYNLPQLEIKK